MRAVALIAVVGALVGIVGCGSSDQTAVAATCLRNALAEPAGQNCGDPTSYDAMKEFDGPMNVRCTHRDGNDYVCDVTGPFTQSATPSVGGFYDVTFDGKSIVYQSSP